MSEDLRSQVENRLEVARKAHAECARDGHRSLVAYQDGRIEAFEFVLSLIEPDETPIDRFLNEG